MQFDLAAGPSSGAGNKLFDKATRRERELALFGCALSFTRLDCHDEMLHRYRHLTIGLPSTSPTASSCAALYHCQSIAALVCH